MLTLKLQRIGKKKQAHFRLIIQEKAKNPKSNVLEILGWYNPRSKGKEFKNERIQHWLSCGAETTPTVHNLLIDAGLIQESKVKTTKISKKRRAKLATKKSETQKVEAPVEIKTEPEIKIEVPKPAESAEIEEKKETEAPEEERADEIKS